MRTIKKETKQNHFLDTKGESKQKIFFCLNLFYEYCHWRLHINIKPWNITVTIAQGTGWCQYSMLSTSWGDKESEYAVMQ